MNLNQVKQKNLKFYKSYAFIILFAVGCSDPAEQSNIYQPSDIVDPNTSLNCTGIWENSPLCVERNEALIELKKLENLNSQLSENNSTKELLDKVKSIRSQGNKFYNEEFYYKARDSYFDAAELIISFQDKNLKRLSKYIIDINSLLNLDKINEAKVVLEKAQSLGISNSELNTLSKRIKNYDQISYLLESANNYLLSNLYEDALSEINKAINLDNIRADLKDTRDTIIEQQNNYNFDLYIKQAYKYLNSLDISLALKYTNFAKNIYPKNNEFLVLEKAVLKTKKQQDLLNFTRNAELNYKQEDWNMSLTNYTLALEISPNEILIKNMITKLNKIIDVKSKLDKFIESPNRLSSENIRKNLKETINLANTLNLTNETKLITLINDAQKLYLKFNKMVLLNINSDNKTYVDIVKTLQYPPFLQESIKLYPGKYTLIAKRKGMQSFRKEINLRPEINQVTYIAECSSKCNIFKSNNSSLSNQLNANNLDNNQETVSNNSIESNATDYIEGAKINNNLFNKNLICNRTTSNNSFKVTFEISLNKGGSVIATKVINNSLLNLSSDDRHVIFIIERALKKSKFNIPTNNLSIKTNKIKYPVSVPRNFCEA